MTEISSDGKCEWDSEKKKLNILNHGIDFDDITEIFDDPYFLEAYDEKNSSITEDRFVGLGEIVALGQISGLVLFVSFTMREARYRIISCRKAVPKEVEKYYDYVKKING